MNVYTWKSGLREIGMIALGIVFLVPLFALVNVAIKPTNSPTTAFEIDPNVTFDNFAKAWQEGALGPALLNSVIVAVVTVFCSVVISAFASYPLARISRRWSRWVYYLFIGGLLIPTQLALLPLYTTMRDLGLLGSLAAVILIGIGGQLPFSVFLYTTFMREMPQDYEEAALIDGCGPVRTFVNVVFPLVKAVTGTVIILNSVGIWNEFFTPLLYLSGSGNTTAPVAIYNFHGQYHTQWPLIFAALCITVLPVLILYFLLQKYIIKGFAGGLKG